MYSASISQKIHTICNITSLLKNVFCLYICNGSHRYRVTQKEREREGRKRER